MSIEHLTSINCDGYHLDIMDNTVVSNFCRHDLMIPALKSLGRPIQVHLMGSQELIAPIAQMAPEIIFVHPKWCPNLDSALSEVRKYYVKVGIVWDADSAEEFFELADEVLFMTVVPGFGGQEFIIDRLEMIKQIIPDKPSWVDGGMNRDTIKHLEGLNVSVIVGSGIHTFA